MVEENELAHVSGTTGLAIDVQSTPSYKAEILHGLFSKLFSIIPADTPALKEQAHRIRYQVFCLENDGYENPERFPDGLETDEFDSQAEHALLIFKPSGTAIGTVRVIMSDEKEWRNSFPLQTICDSPLLHHEAHVKSACEISRFCISDELRRIIKKDLRNSDSLDLNISITPEEKPFLNFAMAMAPVGLMQGMCDIVIRNNKLNYFAVMEPLHMNRCLKRQGVLIEQIGDEINYHGTRIPFRGNILESFEHMLEHNPAVWKILTDNGRLHQNALTVYNKKSGRMN